MVERIEYSVLWKTMRRFAVNASCSRGQFNDSKLSSVIVAFHVRCKCTMQRCFERRVGESYPFLSRSPIPEILYHMVVSRIVRIRCLFNTNRVRLKTRDGSRADCSELCRTLNNRSKKQEIEISSQRPARRSLFLLFAELKVPRRPRKIFHVQLIRVRQTGESYGFNAEEGFSSLFRLFHCRYEVNNSCQTVFNFSLNGLFACRRIRKGRVFHSYLLSIGHFIIYSSLQKFSVFSDLELRYECVAGSISLLSRQQLPLSDTFHVILLAFYVSRTVSSVPFDLAQVHQYKS